MKNTMKKIEINSIKDINILKKICAFYYNFYSIKLTLDSDRAKYMEWLLELENFIKKIFWTIGIDEQLEEKVFNEFDEFLDIYSMLFVNTVEKKLIEINKFKD